MFGDVLGQTTGADNAGAWALAAAVVVSGGTIVVALIGLWVQGRRSRNASEAGRDAVTEGGDRILAAVERIEDQVAVIQRATAGLIEWQDGYQGSVFTDAAAIDRFVSSVEDRFVHLEDMITRHVQWEEQEKQPGLERMLNELAESLHLFHSERGTPIPEPVARHLTRDAGPDDGTV